MRTFSRGSRTQRDYFRDMQISVWPCVSSIFFLEGITPVPVLFIYLFIFRVAVSSLTFFFREWLQYHLYVKAKAVNENGESIKLLLLGK